MSRSTSGSKLDFVKLETAPSFLLAPFSFAASNFRGQRIEARQPQRPESVEPVVDFSKPAGLHGVDAAPPRRRWAFPTLMFTALFNQLSSMKFSFVPEGSDADRKLLMRERGL
jgi:hypothetical protein